MPVNARYSQCVDQNILFCLITHQTIIQLERVADYDDLGITLDFSLSWNKHVHSMTTNANRKMATIKGSIGYKAPLSVKKQVTVYCFSPQSF